MSNFSALKTAIQNAIKQNGNEEITGNLLQGILLSIVETLGDSAINTLETGLSNEATTRGNADTQLNNLITGVKNNVDNGYVYAGIATPSTIPVSGKVFYIALQAGTYTNLGGTTVTEGITILKYNGTSWVKEQVLFTDGGVFDISAYHATGGSLAKYADLTAALGTSGANIPEAIRKGGMSVKYVQSSDNRYVRYNLLADSFTTDVTQWAIDDNGVYVENPEFLAVWIDRNKKIILGVRKDADIYFGAGVPQQIIDYIQEKLGSFSSDVYEDIVTFLGNLIDGDNTLLELFNEKVDKEDGKALIDENVAERVHYVENPEYIEVELDADKKILKATKTNGTKVFYTDVELLGNLSSPVLSELAKEQQKNSVEIEENKKDHFDKSIGFVSTQNSVKSYEEWMSLTGNSILTDEYETLNSISRKPKKKFRRMLAINHDDLPIVDYISQRKLLNKYGFTSSFSYIMRLFSSVEEKETAQENVSKMIKDGQRILLHALFDETSPFADPLYEVKPDKKTNFAPSLAELQPIGSTGKNSLGYSVDSNTKFGSLGFVYPAVDVKVVDATEEQYFTIYSRYCVWNLLANRTGLDFENNLVTKNTLEWFEYIYNSLIDNTLGYSTYNGTVAERYAADYRVPSGGSAIEYYPDLSHIKSGNIIRYSSIGSTTRYEWYAWKHENNIVYTLSNSPQIGDIVYSDTALTQLSTVASIDSNTITDSLSNSYDRFDHLDVVNHLDSSGNQSVGVFTKGLFKGCATCMNIEVLDRIIMIARSYFKHHFGSDVFDGYTAHGGWRSNCVWSYNNYKYYDREKRYLCYEGTKVLNTRLGCYRSIFDVFENNGFKVIVNTPYHSVITPKEGFVYLYEGECEIRPTHLYCWGTPQLPSIAYPNIFNDPNGEIRIGGLTEVLDVFYNISNWEKYILEHTGETVTGRSGDTYVISNWLRRCLMRIVSCFNTGKVPQLSFDTIRNSSLMKLAVEMLYKFCYNNDIDIVSFDEARKVTINTPKPFMTNYFPNPSFQQTIKDFYGVNNTWINIPDGFSEIAGVYTDTSVITVENEQVLETSYNVLKLTAGGISTRIYGLQPGTYKFSCYAKQTANRDGRIKIAKRKNGDEYAIDDTRNMDNISVGNTWALIEKQFVIEQPVVIHDTSNNDIFCDGHQNNTSNVQIVFLSSSNEELDIANPQIVLI